MTLRARGVRGPGRACCALVLHSFPGGAFLMIMQSLKDHLVPGRWQPLADGARPSAGGPFVFRPTPVFDAAAALPDVTLVTVAFAARRGHLERLVALQREWGGAVAAAVVVKAASKAARRDAQQRLAALLGGPGAGTCATVSGPAIRTDGCSQLYSCADPSARRQRAAARIVVSLFECSHYRYVATNSWSDAFYTGHGAGKYLRAAIVPEAFAPGAATGVVYHRANRYWNAALAQCLTRYAGFVDLFDAPSAHARQRLLGWVVQPPPHRPTGAAAAWGGANVPATGPAGPVASATGGVAGRGGVGRWRDGGGEAWTRAAFVVPQFHALVGTRAPAAAVTKKSALVEWYKQAAGALHGGQQAGVFCLRMIPTSTCTFRRH